MASALLTLLNPLSEPEREVRHQVAQGASEQEMVEALALSLGPQVRLPQPGASVGSDRKWTITPAC